MLLENFAPQEVLRHFEDVCAIPHGSGNERALADHIATLAQANGHEVLRDDTGNVFVRVAAASGCEGAPPLLIQGHMDMVCAKAEGCPIDMEKEPIRLVVEGNILRADGTSLGADNAVALCHMMALMEPHDFPHPPLELLFTVEEETTMRGVKAFDTTLLRARAMVNMDGGDPDTMVVGSAGGCGFRVERQYAPSPCGDGDKALTVTIQGLRGGHGGLEAGKNRGNAVLLSARLLDALCRAVPMGLAALASPQDANIPTWTSLTVVYPAAEEDTVRGVIAACDGAFRAELDTIEPDYCLTTVDAAAESAISPADTRLLADTIALFPQDVLRRDEKDIRNILGSSLLTHVTLENGAFRGRWRLRYSAPCVREQAVPLVEGLCRLAGLSVEPYGNDTPPWQYREVSPLRDVCLRVYRDTFGEEMHTELENGSIEPSYLTRAVPDMDCVVFAPKSRGAHTPKEHLYLDTMAPFWDYFKAVLAALC